MGWCVLRDAMERAVGQFDLVVCTDTRLAATAVQCVSQHGGRVLVRGLRRPRRDYGVAPGLLGRLAQGVANRARRVVSDRLHEQIGQQCVVTGRHADRELPRAAALELRRTSGARAFAPLRALVAGAQQSDLSLSRGGMPRAFARCPPRGGRLLAGGRRDIRWRSRTVSGAGAQPGCSSNRVVPAPVRSFSRAY